MFEGVTIQDAQGDTQNVAWLRGQYGNIRIRKAEDGEGMRVVGLYEKVGPANLQAMVLDEAGKLMQGWLVARRWPYREHNANLPVVAPTLDTWFSHGVDGPTEENGVIGFATGGGDFYSPGEGVMGASTIWCEGLSDAVEGLGVLREPGYPSMDVVFQYKGENGPPPPSGARELILSVKADLAVINMKLDEALRLLP